jgi:hypothetical protein
LPNRWTDEPESGEQPKTDLNPLLNPLLEENLGRWAQVYFTNPPETRERAVMELLRELENRQENPGSEVPPNSSSLNPISLAAASQASASFPEGKAAPSGPKSVCPVCNGENRLDQKFCGFCGTTLHAGNGSSKTFATDYAKAAAPLEPEPELPPVAHPVESLSFLGLSSAGSDNELDSLRERPFDKSYYEPESSHRGLYLAAALVILIGGITYLTWPMLLTHMPLTWQQALTRPPARVTAATNTPPSSSSPSFSDAQAAPTTPSGAPTSEPATAAPEPSTGENAKAAAQPKTQAAVVAKNGVIRNSEPSPPPARSVTLASESQSSRAATSTADGNQELSQAEKYLKSGHSQADSSQAARWLWKSVGKQNSHAAVMLADLYVRGDGVSRNCDEARILLGAAAKKGMSEAAQKLSSLDSNCH